MQNQIQDLNQNQPPKKEPFFFISTKNILAILIFTALAVVIIGGWVYVIGGCGKSEADNKIAEPANQKIEVNKKFYCEKDNDCLATCSSPGCYNKKWYEIVMRGDCEAMIKHTCKCVNNKCQISDDKQNNTSNWQTYQNEEIGVEFKYPMEFGNPKTKLVNYTLDKRQEIFSGKKIIVTFENVHLTFTAKTKNFNAFMELNNFTGNDKIEYLCSSGKGQTCKILNLPNIKAVLKNVHNNIECSSFFSTQIYINNKSDSIYKGITFLLGLKDVTKEIEDNFTCIDERDDTANNDIANFEKTLKKLSENIIDKKNLSERDLEFFNNFEKILSTFKFTN